MKLGLCVGPKKRHLLKKTGLGKAQGEIHASNWLLLGEKKLTTKMTINHHHFGRTDARGIKRRAIASIVAEIPDPC